jgi:hypothetical protein
VKIHAPTLLLVFLAASGIAQAQVASDKPPPAPAEAPGIDFATVDKDASGKLSKQEVAALAELEGVFATLDTDHDGSLTAVEFSHWARAGRTAPVARDPATAPGGSAGAQHMPTPH